MAEVLPPNSDIDGAMVTPTRLAGLGAPVQPRQRLDDFLGLCAINLAMDSESITATGSTQATAARVDGLTNRIVAGAAGTGAILPLGTPGQVLWILNSTATTKIIYPAVGDTLNGFPVNKGISLLANSAGLFYHHTTVGWDARGFGELPISTVTVTAGGSSNVDLSAVSLVTPTTEVEVILNGTLSADVNCLLPSAALLINAFNLPVAGQILKMRLVNASPNAHSYTLVAPTGWVVSGNSMVVPGGYYREYLLEVDSFTAGKVIALGGGIYNIDGVAGYYLTTTLLPKLNGMHGGLELPITTARSATGVPLTATATGGAFGQSFSVGATTRLVSEAANSSTVTDTACFEFQIPMDYVATQDITVTVFGQYVLGGGAVGTHTLAAQFHWYGAAGNASSNLIATAAQALPASNGAMTFTITGTALTPGTRGVLTLVMVLQATTGVNITGQLNQVLIG